MSVFVAVLLVSAQAASEPPAPAQAAVEAPKAKPKKICKVDPETSGSHMVKRLCLTEEEWAEHGQGVNQGARAGFSGKPQDH
jgi:hypothetical protein